MFSMYVNVGLHTTYSKTKKYNIHPNMATNGSNKIHKIMLSPNKSSDDLAYESILCFNFI